MKNFSFAKYSNKVWILALAVVMAACTQFEAQGPSDDLALEDSDALFRLEEMHAGMQNARTEGPIYLDGANNGGNVLCSEAATYFKVEDGFEFTSPDPEGQGGNEYLGDNQFKESFPEGFTVTVTDNKFVSWSFEPIIVEGKRYCLKDLVVLVKGGRGANAYYYGEGQTSDSGLESPVNQGGNVPNLSNLKLCYNLELCEDEEKCWDDETAWARGYRFTKRGNWAMYFDGPTQAAIDATPEGDIIPLPKIGGGTSLTKTLLAGQNLQAGTFKLVKTADPSIFKAVIIINQFQPINGIIWRFSPDQTENVKVQDYVSTPPAKNPAPGLFAHKFSAPNKGEDRIDFLLPRNNFYAVHVDLERQVTCPE